ncbi:MAG TPA: hypothetical protein VKU83_11835, partial [Puia sp.]|nr:hypothetical protein [Puia sp.]
MDKVSPVAIAGTGIVSAIGDNRAECLAALAAGCAGIDDIRLLDSAHRGRLPVAEVKHPDAELAAMAGVDEAAGRTALLALIAAREALESARLPDLGKWRTGLISANTVGGMDRTEQFFAQGARGKLRDVVRHECGW